MDAIYIRWFMSYFYSWNELKNDNLDFGSQLANHARRFACRLWRDYARNFVDSNPGTAPQRWVWNNMCQMPPVNQTPYQPYNLFSNGQCNAKYTVYIRWNRVDILGDPPNQTCSISQDPQSQYTMPPYGNRGEFWGPIGGVKLATKDSGNCGGFLNFRILCHGFGNQTRLTTQQWILVTQLPGGSSSGRLRGVNQMSVAIAPGATDNCGTLPINYPYVDPPAPGEETYNVTINDGANNNYTFPLIWNDVDFEMPIKFDFEVGELEVNFDGIEFNFDKDNNWELPPKQDDINDKLDDIIEEIDNIPRGGGGYSPPEDYDEEESPTEEEEEEEVANDPKIAWVLVDITSTPLHGSQHTILQNNAEDSTFFAGYFSWTYGEYRHPEQPIRKLKNAYKNDIGADGFRLYTVNGAKLKYTILREKTTEGE